MLKKIILKVLYSIKSLFNKFSRLRNFYLPNLIYLLENDKTIGKNCVFNQVTRFVGSGLITLGSNCSFGFRMGGFIRGAGIEIQTRGRLGKINFGNNVSTNNNIFIAAANHIVISDYVRIGQNVTIMDFEAHGISPNLRSKIGEIGTIFIGNNVWIGNNVIILKNSSIGKNSIVAAGAVVSGKFPENVIIGGVPAKIIKKIIE